VRCKKLAGPGHRILFASGLGVIGVLHRRRKKQLAMKAQPLAA
jgi:hypothetical protein